MNTLFADGASLFLRSLPGQFSIAACAEKEQGTTKVPPEDSALRARHGKHGVKKTKQFKISTIKQIVTSESPKDQSKRARHGKHSAKNAKKLMIPTIKQIATTPSPSSISSPPPTSLTPPTPPTPRKPRKPATPPKLTISSTFSSSSIEKVLSWLSVILKALLLFLAVEFINAQTQTIVQFQYVDFRLLYVVIIGSIFGISPGLLAGGLACLAVLNGFETLNVHWYTLLYNIQNWLPFAGYLLAGSITGYLCNKRAEDQKVAHAQLDEATEKLQATEKFYEEALADNEQLRYQIINSDDSLGKTLSIVRSLDAPFPELALLRTVSVFEKVLNNRSIALFTTDINHEHIYFHSCSKPFAERLPHAISLDSKNFFWTNLKENKLWVNRDYVEGCPDYCLMLSVASKYHVAIMVCDAKPSQMATYYTNQIKVLGELVQDSLDRSTKYFEQVEDQMYVSDTRILQYPWFRKIVIAKQDQQKQGAAEHVLLQIECPGHVTLNQAHDRILSYIHPGDVLGLGPEGDLFVVLSRMKSNELAAMQNTLTKTGLSFEQRITLEHSEEDEPWTSLSLGA